MAVARLASAVLSCLEIVFAIIAVGLAGWVNRNELWASSHLRFVISACVLTAILAIACLVVSCIGPQKVPNMVLLPPAVFSAVYWLIAVAWMGAQDSGIFNPSEDCELDGNGARVDPAVCHIFRVALAAWVFGFLLLILWLLSAVVAILAIVSGSGTGRSQGSSAFPAGTAPHPETYQNTYSNPQYAQSQLPPHGQHNAFQPMNVQQQQPKASYAPQPVGLKPPPV